MTELERHDVTSRLYIAARQLQGICRMIQGNRPDSEILTQIKAAGLAITGIRRTVKWLATERMVHLAAGLRASDRDECIRAIMDMDRKFGE